MPLSPIVLQAGSAAPLLFGEDAFDCIEYPQLRLFLQSMEDQLSTLDSLSYNTVPQCYTLHQLTRLKKRLNDIAEHMQAIGQTPQRRFLNVLWSMHHLFWLQLRDTQRDQMSQHRTNEIERAKSDKKCCSIGGNQREPFRLLRRRFVCADIFSHLHACLKDVWQLHSTLEWAMEDVSNYMVDSERGLALLTLMRDCEVLASEGYQPVFAALGALQDLPARSMFLLEVYQRCAPNLWAPQTLIIPALKNPVEEGFEEDCENTHAPCTIRCTRNSLIPHFVWGGVWEGEPVLLLEAHARIATGMESRARGVQPMDCEFQALFFSDAKHRFVLCHPGLLLVHGIVQARPFSLLHTHGGGCPTGGETPSTVSSASSRNEECVGMEPCSCLVMCHPHETHPEFASSVPVVSLEDVLFSSSRARRVPFVCLLRWMRQLCDVALYLALNTDHLPNEVRAQYQSLCPSHIFLVEQNGSNLPDDASRSEVRVVPPMYYHLNTRWRAPEGAANCAAYNLALLFLCMWTRQKPWGAYPSHQPLTTISAMRAGAILPYPIPSDLPIELRVALARCFLLTQSVSRNPRTTAGVVSLVRGGSDATSLYPSVIMLEAVFQDAQRLGVDAKRLRAPMTVREFVDVLQTYWHTHHETHSAPMTEVTSFHAVGSEPLGGEETKARGAVPPRPTRTADNAKREETQPDLTHVLSDFFYVQEVL